MSNKPDESTLMDLLMEHIKDNIYFMDREGHIVMISKEGAKWLGFDSQTEVIGKTDLDIFTDEHGLDAYEDEQRIMQTGIPVVGKEEKETWEDGHETWVSTTKMPLRDNDGRIIGTFGISRDITEHKQAELRATSYAEQNRRLCDEMERDSQMAAELQKTFFPHAYPVFPSGVNTNESAARFCHYHHSTGSIGGDFCSIRKLSDTEAGILLCDVMGHGVRAALITALMRAIVEEISYREKNPGRFLQHMNRVLKPIIQHDDLFMFSTACYLIVDIATGGVRYANAGHPVPILLHASDEQAEWLVNAPSTSGPALTIDANAEYTTYERVIHAGDAIVMYTDGLYEVTNGEGEELGQVQLLEMTNKHRNLSLTDLFPTLIKDIGGFAPNKQFDDDVCLVGFRLAHLLNH